MIAFLCCLALANEIAPPPEGPPSASILEQQVPRSAGDFEVQRLVAWARTYGYLRWFHPSDELAQVDLERLACLGAQRAMKAEDPVQLAEAFTALIQPVAPTARVWMEGQEPPQPVVVDQKEGQRTLAWMHHGVGLDGGGLYSSVRSGRTQTVPRSGAGFGNLSQSVSAEGLAGMAFRFSASVRVDQGQAQLWLRTDGGEDRFFDNMGDRPVQQPEWGRHVVEGVVPPTAERIVFGAFVPGLGTADVDDFRLEVKGEDGWEPIALSNGALEKGTKGWKAESQGYQYSAVDGVGGKGLRIARLTTQVAPRFERVPERGTLTEAAVGAKLRVAIPVVLVEDDGGTLPRGEVAPMVKALEAVPCDDPEDLATRVAAVAISWNVHQHFHPYLDVVEADWMAALDQAMLEAIEAQDAASFRRVLERMTARLQDGHVWIRGGPRPDGRLPLSLDVLDGEVVVRQSGIAGVSPGDVLIQIDGRPVSELHAEMVPLVAGSPQVVTQRAAGAMLWGEGSASVEVRRPDGDGASVQAAYVDSYRPEPMVPPVRTLEDGVVVVDLTQVTWEALKPRLKELSRAPGVVIDVRGYPTNAGFQLLAYVLDEPTDADWMFVPEYVLPDQGGTVEWVGASWHLKPRGPHLGNTVWITDQSAISYAESVLGHVRDLDVGPLVGRATAGANGNVNPYTVPGGYRISWTGMKVLNRDGSQHHVIGVLPTHPVTPTPQGLAEGRDEELERALELVREASSATGVR